MSVRQHRQSVPSGRLLVQDHTPAFGNEVTRLVGHLLEHGDDVVRGVEEAQVDVARKVIQFLLGFGIDGDCGRTRATTPSAAFELAAKDQPKLLKSGFRPALRSAITSSASGQGSGLIPSRANSHVWNGPMTGHTAEAAKSTRLTQLGHQTSACFSF